MALFAQILAWLSVAAGVIVLGIGWLTVNISGSAGLAASLIIGGVMLGVLGEIASNIQRMRDIADKSQELADTSKGA